MKPIKWIWKDMLDFINITDIKYTIVILHSIVNKLTDYELDDQV